MNELLRPQFDAILHQPGTAAAMAPLLALALGFVGILLADVVPGLARARRFVFPAALATAVVALAHLHEVAPGVVLGGTYAADATTALWGLIFVASTGLAWAFGAGYYRGGERPFGAEHDALLLAAPLGMMLMVGARDLVVFFIGLELLSIPLYVLAAFRRSDPRSVEAGLKYFLLGAFGSALFLYGAALLYSGTGTVSLVALRELGVATPLASAGVALIVASIFFKVSVFPFHLWVPDVYQGSPTPVTALMASGTKAAAFGFLIPATFLLPAASAGLVAAIALVTIAGGNLGALVQEDLKRLLAYSGIAHAGTLLLVVAGALRGDPEPQGAVQAALFYMAAYVFTSTGAFGVLAALETEGASTRLADLRGLARRRPGAAAALSLFLLSLGGIPATGGFLGKWFVFAVLVRADMFAAAVIGVLLSVVALGYYLRVIVVMYMQDAAAGAPQPSGPRPMPAAVATVLCSAFVLLLGVWPGWLLGWMR